MSSKQLIIGMLVGVMVFGGLMLIYKKKDTPHVEGCTQDANCPDGKKCVEGECVNGCSDTQDCADGYICYLGGCVKPTNIGSCDKNSDCKNGFGCSPSGKCIPPGSIECINDVTTCPTSWGCFGGYCKPSCDSDTDCVQGSICSESGKCIESNTF
jgi:hypothetical protein